MFSKSIVLKRIVPYVKRYWLAYALISFFLVVDIGLDLIFANYLKTLTDAAVDGNINQVTKYLALGLLLICISFLTAFFSTVINTMTVSKIKRDIRLDLYSHFLKFNINYLAKTKSGDTLSRLFSNVNGLSDLIGSNLVQLLRHPIAAIVTFIYLCSINWILASVCLLLGPAALFIGSIFGKHLRENSKKQQEYAAETTSLLNDTIFGFIIARTYRLEGIFFNNYQKKINDVYTYELKGGKLGAAFRASSGTIGLSTFMISLGLGAFFVVSGQLTVGSLIAFVSLTQNLITPFTGLSQIWTRFQQSLASGERVFKIFDESKDILFLKAPKESYTEFNDNLSLHNIEFMYDERMVLKGINLKIEKGENIAIIGPSGSGKSTLVKVILGLCQPNKGKIYVDGYDLYEYNHDFRDLFSYVPQDPILFSGTIKENIRFGNYNCNDQQIIEASKLARAHEFIVQLEKGYEEIIGERGATLSGGQKQRLALARAFLRDAPIIVLDEATSSLDYILEYDIMEATQDILKNKTTIVIAHRVETIRNADKIIVMNKGEIVDIGKHEELLNSSEIYREIYNTLKNSKVKPASSSN